MYIPELFYILLFSNPLILYRYTSELFEFNKMVLIYLFTAIIIGLWVIKMILAKKIIFRRTIFDRPLLLFLGSQLLATIFSIDVHTSLLGYYSRFNGGLASSLSYALLFWAFVSNMDKEKTLKSLKILIISSILVSIYAVAQHFGIDRDVWVQDVQNRVFSTLGQPNWLAAWLVALFPLVWVFMIKSKEKAVVFWFWEGVFILGFFAFLFTKSRSGILGFLVADIIFWGISLFKHQKKVVKTFVICHLSFVIIGFLVGTPWTPSINVLINKSTNIQISTQPQGTALETGGTESGVIRKIVWKGAIEIWKHHPILGTGPETFAYSYYNYRPKEHNLTSEWDFLYNKAHNEYLNYLATSGIVGTLAYLFFIGTFVYFVFKRFPKIKSYHLALGAGFGSILVTNFFGFSVVPISTLFYLFPAMAVSLGQEGERVKEYKLENLTVAQKIGILISCSLALLLLYSISKYWYADTLYAKGKDENKKGNYTSAASYLAKAATLSPSEAIYWEELSDSVGSVAISFAEASKTDEASKFSKMAVDYSNFALKLSPVNLNILRGRASLFLKLSSIDPNYLKDVKNTLELAQTLAPTDAKISYNLGLILVRLGEIDEALKSFQKAIELKSNYRDARFAYALILIDRRDFGKARDELNYILKNIAPNDSQVTSQLEEIKGR